MKNIRIIPRLDIKGPNVVKPIQTEALRVVGNPRDLAWRYYQAGADEILYMDIVASLYQRSIDFNLLKSVTEGIFIPVTVGGGIRTIQDINNMLRAGADKVAINTHVVSNPLFIKEAVREFGSQCIMLSLEAKQQPSGRWEAYTDGGREHSGRDAIEWAKQAVDLGVGEILVTSIDQDGRRQGYDLDLIKTITAFAPIPVIAHGGGQDPKSVYEAITDGKADAIAASSIFHYNTYSINEVKHFLVENGINIRLL